MLRAGAGESPARYVRALAREWLHNATEQGFFPPAVAVTLVLVWSAGVVSAVVLPLPSLFDGGTERQRRPWWGGVYGQPAPSRQHATYEGV